MKNLQTTARVATQEKKITAKQVVDLGKASELTLGNGIHKYEGGRVKKPL